MRAGWVLLMLCLGMAGCGVANPGGGCHPNAVPYALRVGPAALSSTAPNHSAKPPGNQEPFAATVLPDPGPGCPVPQFALLVNNANWTVSQPDAVSINSTAGADNGVATCQAATDGAAEVKATVSYSGFQLSDSTTITCQ